jgi:ABC-type Fe3+/spermidine/putrescine transport system ATPase subunit
VGFLEGVAAGLTVAAVVAAANWLRIEQNREALREKLRQVTCRHDRQPIQTSGPNWIYVTHYEEECRKCGAQR